MIIKGIVSAIYEDQKKISAILPEYDFMTTKPLTIYGTPNMGDYDINDFVIILALNDDFNDMVILPKGLSYPDGDTGSYGYPDGDTATYGNVK